VLAIGNWQAMATTSTTDTIGTVRSRSERYDAIERGLRLWSGVVLFLFVLTHLLNHAVGIAGVDAMTAVQDYRVWLWRTLIGSVLLYGAALLHILFVTKRLISRRTWRMPATEAMQIALGFAIPLLLYEHVIGTRYVAEFHGVNDTYAATLRFLWPAKGVMHTVLLLVVWVHGVLGLYYALRAKSWFPRARETLLILAVVIPLAALAGFVAGGREALELGHEGANWTEAQRAAALVALRYTNYGLLVFAAGLTVLIIGLAAKRRLGKRVPIRYLGHGLIELPRGSTILEGSREVGIPHPSLCGGRARCSTCRVLITEGADTLAAPGQAESAMLKRIAAPSRVRLACQIRPERPISLQILLPIDTEEGNVDWSDEAMKWGTAREATVLFVDLRSFQSLTRTQLPYDLVALLNRFISEMRQATAAHGGRPALYLSDGLMAVFGLNGERGAGSRNAIAAARDMQRAMIAMNEELHAALSIPLRIGIGIHTGPVVIARVGDDAHGYSMTALGETVTYASQLEAATKAQLCDTLMSEATLRAAGRRSAKAEARLVRIGGQSEPIKAFALEDTDAPDTGAEDADGTADGAEDQPATTDQVTASATS
jgi:adenylate cyclase